MKTCIDTVPISEGGKQARAQPVLLSRSCGRRCRCLHAAADLERHVLISVSSFVSFIKATESLHIPSEKLRIIVRSNI